MIRWQLPGLAVATWLFFKNLPAALLCLNPGLQRARETDDDGSLTAEKEPAMERVERGMAQLGFLRIGAMQVRPPLSGGWCELVYAAPALQTFADVGVRGGALAVNLFTPFEAGAAVATSDYRRSSIERSDYLAGGLPGADIPELWAVHRRRVGRLAEGRQPWSDFTLPGRLEAQRVFLRGAGGSELRALSLSGLMIGLIALALGLVSALELVGLTHRA
jgi:hypothetical protein